MATAVVQARREGDGKRARKGGREDGRKEGMSDGQVLKSKSEERRASKMTKI